MLGKTGCGKSTMFNIVAGLTEPSAGEVAVIGHDPFREFRFFPRQDRHRVPERPADAVAHGAR